MMNHPIYSQAQQPEDQATKSPENRSEKEQSSALLALRILTDSNEDGDMQSDNQATP